MKSLSELRRFASTARQLKEGLGDFVAQTCKRDKSVVFALLFFTLLLFSTVFADYVAPRPYWEGELSERLQAPSWRFPLGSDQMGRDILSRIIYGGRTLMYSISIVLAVSTSLGLLLGLLSGYYGGVVDILAMRTTDILLCFPPIILAFGILAVLGVGLENAIIASSIFFIAPFARLTRGQVLSAKELLYVDNAKVIGCADARIIFHHILPNIISPLVVQMTFNAASVILLVGALGFIGLGTQPPTADWGTMMYEARDYMNLSSYPLFFPGLCIFLAAFSFNTLGEALRDYWDIRERAL